MTVHTIGTAHVSGTTGGKPLDPSQPLTLLVHGAGMNRTVWSLQTRWLAHHGVSAVAIDLPGHGTSPDTERTSIADYADWLTGVVDAAGRPVHLVGHSMGTFIAIEVANRTAVASITLVGTAASMPVHPALLEAAENNDPLAAQLMSGWAFAPASKTAPHPSPGATMVGGTQALIAQAGPGVLHRDLAMCAAYDQAVESMAAADAPTTFLLGKADRMTPVANAQPLIDAATEPSVHVVPGVGHMIQVEAPSRTREVIASTVTAQG